MRSQLIKMLLASLLLLVFAQISTAAQLPLIVQIIENSQPTLQEITKAKQQLQDTKKIELKEKLSLNAFHKRSEIKKSSTNYSYCTTCHIDIPHNTSLRSRTFNNMHSQFIACETCHFKPENIQLNYRWYDYSFATEANSLSGRLHSGVNKKDKTAKVARNNKVKIAPFNRHKPAIISENHEFSSSLQLRWKNASIDEQATIKAKIHKPLASQASLCADCHTENNDMLNLRLLSDSKDQANAIQKNTIANFFKRYQAKKTHISETPNKEEQRIKITDLLN